MIRVNIVGAVMMLYYLIFYMLYTRSKSYLIMQLSLVVIWIAASIVFVSIFPSLAFNYYGIPCAIFNIINFGAPLAGITVVLRRRSCDTLPFPLIVASVLVSAQWCAFGILQGYMEMIIPNGAGILLGLLQLSFFLVFPSQPGKHAPLGWYFACIRGLERPLPEKTPVIEYGIRSMGRTFNLLAHTLPNPYISALPNRRESMQHIHFL
ncbi:sugar efflux transporter for intercellular exchange domain-containing protein [Ditylenchus destructor]|uniref:Sugar transporter SWEET1 n=1 Tax=Ditylenchus destructor TaxID=166010 RepID=A0AAD4NF07_9BILA|nr:sugar efflux transporter for intercellular exchange domain-containing protein [Ditylenchus destructor]